MKRKKHVEIRNNNNNSHNIYNTNMLTVTANSEQWTRTRIVAYTYIEAHIFTE